MKHEDAGAPIPAPNLGGKSVLEQNLEKLFARAYVPIEPSAQVRARILGEVLRQGFVPSRSRVPSLLRAAAAILFVLGGSFLAWRFARTPVRSVEEVLASGRAAVREGKESAWRAVSDEEARSGVRLATASLDAVTPGSVSVSVRLGAADRLDLAPNSSVALENDPERGLAVSLERGAVALERAPNSASIHGASTNTGPAHVATVDGTVRLESGVPGVIELALLDLDGARATRALLRSGEAVAEVEPRTVLVAGRPTWIRSGAIVVEPGLDSGSGSAGTRTDAAADAAPAPSVAAPSTPTQGALHGTLAAGPGEKLPESFTVTLLRTERLPEVSRPDAREFRGDAFAIDGLRPGTYSIYVQAAGFATWRRGDVEIPGGTDPARPVELRVALDRGTSLRGHVLDADGNPVGGATVISETDTPSQLLPFVSDDRTHPVFVSATSLRDGTFEIGPLSRGHQRFRATCAGHGATWSEPVDLAAEVPADLVLRLVRPGAIEGRVARDDGSPWPNAPIVASWLEMSGSYLDRAKLGYGFAIADGMGKYAIEDLPPGLFVVLNVEEGREPGSTRIPRVQQIRVEPGVRAHVDLPGGEQGTVVEGKLLTIDEKPLGGRDVTFIPATGESFTWKSTRSREDGRFDFPSLVPGPYFVYAGGDFGTELALQTEIEVPAAPLFQPVLRCGGGVLRGRVTDALTGRGLATSIVILEVESSRGPMFAGKIAADAEGRYSLAFLPAGKYRATAYAIVGRFGQESVDALEIGRGPEPTSCDFALRPGASVTVRLHDEGGKPLAGSKLRFVDGCGVTVSFSPDDRTDARGELVVHGVKPGRWILRVDRERYETSDTVLNLVADEDRTVEITLHAVH